MLDSSKYLILFKFAPLQQNMINYDICSTSNNVHLLLNKGSIRFEIENIL